MNDINVNISKILRCNVLSTREAAHLLFEKASRKNKISRFMFNWVQIPFAKSQYQKDKFIFDFKNITNISRTFADEFIKKSYDLKRKADVNIFVKNTSSDISNMLNIVEISQAKKKTVPEEEFHYLAFPDDEALEEFLAPL